MGSGRRGLTSSQQRGRSDHQTTYNRMRTAFIPKEKAKYCNAVSYLYFFCGTAHYCSRNQLCISGVSASCFPKTPPKMPCMQWEKSKHSSQCLRLKCTSNAIMKHKSTKGPAAIMTRPQSSNSMLPESRGSPPSSPPLRYAQRSQSVLAPQSAQPPLGKPAQSDL